MAASGNHDIALFALWARLTRPDARQAVACGAEPDPVRESQDLLIVGVNTTRAWRHQSGAVPMAQIDRVETHPAAASPRQLRVVSLAQLHRAVSRGHVPL